MVDCLDEPLSRDKGSSVYPTALTASDGYFVVGDSVGTLHIYEVSIAEKKGPRIIKRNTIEDKELEGDMIRTIHLLNKSDMIVQSKDNVIRKISITGGRAKHIQKYSYPNLATSELRVNIIQSGQHSRLTRNTCSLGLMKVASLCGTLTEEKISIFPIYS